MTKTAFDVEEFYKKEPNLRKQMAQLREWSKNQPHLPEATEEQLILFLHSCYYSLEKAKTTMDNFFTIRSLNPTLFDIFEISKIRNAFATLALTMLEKQDSDRYCVFLYKFLDFNPDNFDISDTIAIFNMQKMLYLHQHGPMEELIVIVDLKGLTFGHIVKSSNMRLIKTIMVYLQEASPVRIKQIHYLNVKPIFDKIFSLMKPFIKKKLLNSIHFHKSISDLWHFLPPDILDFNEYGGTKSLTAFNEQTMNNIIANLDLLEFWSQQKVDESKRNVKIDNSAFGGDGGGFKTLNLD